MRFHGFSGEVKVFHLKRAGVDRCVNVVTSLSPPSLYPASVTGPVTVHCVCSVQFLIFFDAFESDCVCVCVCE